MLRDRYIFGIMLAPFSGICMADCMAAAVEDHGFKAAC